MTAKKRKLQLVPYQPDNYSSGEVLALDDATVITSENSIGAAFSLYFQWEKKRSCHVTLSQKSTGKALSCSMDYDHDESSPTEIRIQLDSSRKPVKIVPGASILIRFEVFKVAYMFNATVTATADDPQKEGWYLITDVPTELKVIRTRRLPRVVLTDETRTKLPSAKWSSSLEKGVKVSLKLLEIGLASIHASFDSPVNLKDKTGVLEFGVLKFETQVVRATEHEIVLTYEFHDPLVFGAFFDYYRLVAYPSMRSRYEIPYKAGIDLYARSNYFGTFNAEKTPEEKQEIMDTWEAIKTGFHKTNADYYITDSVGNPTGCSGLALTNYSGDESVWAFHQLCSLRDPNLLEQSGVLYTWRSEYLSARPELLSVWGTFRSKSRWLERIYVKHAMSNRPHSKLIPVINQRCTILKETTKSKIKINHIKIGNIERLCTNSSDIWGGINPKFLNASGNLDVVVAVSRPTSVEELKGVASKFSERLKQNQISLVFIIPPESTFEALEKKVGPSDRFFQFPKSDLISFITSVDHSVAVTERKLQNGIN